MVVRRTPGKKIRIVHVISKDVIELTVLQVTSRTAIQVNLDYSEGFQVSEVKNDYARYLDPGEMVLHCESNLDILHKSGDEMLIQIVDISHKDTNIRLVDEKHLFRFEWSQQFLNVG
jgi:hypothetical protein